MVALAVKSNEYQEQTMSSSARTALWEAVCALQERVNAALKVGLTVIDVLDAAAEAMPSSEASELLAALRTAGLSMSFSALDASAKTEENIVTLENKRSYIGDVESEVFQQDRYEVILRLQSGPDGAVHNLRVQKDDNARDLAAAYYRDMDAKNEVESCTRWRNTIQIGLISRFQWCNTEAWKENCLAREANEGY